MIGLDLSVSATGIAHQDGRTETVRPRPASLAGGARLHHLRPLIRAAFYWPDGHDGHQHPDAVVVEDYSPGSVGIAGKLTNAELRGVVLVSLHAAGVPRVGFVRPSTLKRWATGNGAADKAAMVAAAQRSGWTGDPRRHDEADAWHLRAMGLQHLTGHGGTPEQLAIADTIRWT